MTIVFNIGTGQYMPGDFASWKDEDAIGRRYAQSCVDGGYAAIVVPPEIEPIEVNDGWSETKTINKKK